MDLSNIREYALDKPGTSEDTPFGPDTLVFRVLHKMLALASMEAVPPQINLKCDPERAVELREQYDAVLPGYHQNKKHWNTVIIDGTIPDREIYAMIDHSYDCVVRGLKRSERAELEMMQ